MHIVDKQTIGRLLPFIYILVTGFLFLLRMVFFAENYGGIEHDSGWYLGVAKNLAQRGIYASYTNTIIEEGKGAYPSIHGRFSVQDGQGFSYFPAGVTVGPGYVVPEAIILKIFGNGWWQYRAWPLLGYTLLLLVSFYLVFKIGGFFSLLIFQIWLWVLPQFAVNFSYESLSEHIALLFILSGFICFVKRYMFLAGLFISLAYLTKALYLLNGAVFLPILGWEIYHNRRNLKALIRRWLTFILGFILPVLIYESYRYIALVSQFGLAGWEAINKDIQLTFDSGGSGLSNLKNFNLKDHFVLQKLIIWSDIGIYKLRLIWLLFLVAPIILIYLKKQYRLLIFLIFGASAISFVWFILISPVGWGRHIWHGLFMGMMLISMVIGIFIQTKVAFWRSKGLSLILLFIFVLPILRLDKIQANFFLNQGDIEKWYRYREERRIQGFPPLPIFPLHDQQAAIDYFRSAIKDKDRIYYHGGYLVSELSPLTDKVFYPLKRYANNKYQSPEGGESYLIFSPYQQGPLKIVSDSYLASVTEGYCEEVVYRNPSYLLCRLKRSEVKI